MYEMIKLKTFTFVELLVVVSVLALLISLLNPTLDKVFKQASIAGCQNQMKHATSTALLISDDQDGLLPRGGIGNTGGFVIWMINKSVKQFTDYGLKRDWLICPTISAGKDHNVSINQGGHTLMHNQYFGNNSAMNGRRRANIPQRNYLFPTRSTDNGDLPLFADGNTYTNWGGGWTLAPHSGNENRLYEGYPLEPSLFGSDGGNVAYLNGSVFWKDYADMNHYYNHTTNSSYGMW